MENVWSFVWYFPWKKIFPFVFLIIHVEFLIRHFFSSLYRLCMWVFVCIGRILQTYATIHKRTQLNLNWWWLTQWNFYVYVQTIKERKIDKCFFLVCQGWSNFFNILSYFQKCFPFDFCSKIKTLKNSDKQEKLPLEMRLCSDLCYIQNEFIYDVFIIYFRI